MRAAAAGQTSAFTRRKLLAICFCGVALRLVALFLAVDLELLRDEGRYVYLAVSWNRFGFLLDSQRYLWPPGYVFFLARCLAWFEVNGLLVAKLVQVFASASIGMATMLLARRFFGDCAAFGAGVAWCLYLPLVGFTHTLWNETLFLALLLPALVLLAEVLDEPGRVRDSRLLAAGVLFAASLYVKDALLYLTPLIALLLGVRRRAVASAETARQALLFLLVVAVLVLPWTLRNAEVYGRFVPLGSTLGENVFRGLNATYVNFDLNPFKTHFFLDEAPADRSRAWFIASRDAQGWERADEILNLPDRMAENVRRAVRFSLADPGWLVRSRIKKMADLVAPVSFSVRNLGVGAYGDTPFQATAVRRTLLVFALLCPVVVLWFAVPGLVGLLRHPPPSAGLLVLVLAYFGATALLVSMSRFRIPMIPLLIALAAGFVWGERKPGGRDLQFWGLTALGWAGLLFLWWVDAPEMMSIVQLLWRGASG